MTHNPFILPEGISPDPLTASIPVWVAKLTKEREHALTAQLRRYGWPTTAEYVTEHISARREPVEGFGERTRYFHDGTPFLVETIWTTMDDGAITTSIEQKFEFLALGAARS